MLKPPHQSKRTIRSYVLRASHMTAGQKRALQTLWPQYGIEAHGLLNFAEIFGNNAPVVLEIGFGNGDALATLAKEHADYNFLGVEVHRPGVGHLLQRLDNEQLNNVRILCKDAVEVLTQHIAEQSLHTINVFFPDPWHKKRHHKRRLVQATFVELLEKTLVNKGIFHFATDWQNYADHVKTTFQQISTFQFCDLDATFARPTTKFEQRGIGLGHQISDLVYRKINP